MRVCVGKELSLNWMISEWDLVHVPVEIAGLRSRSYLGLVYQQPHES